MNTDKVTLTDLSIFSSEEEFSLFQKLNFTQTTNGKEHLKKTLGTPLQSLQEIAEVQETIKFVDQRAKHWPTQITNGTIMVVEQFFESPVVELPAHSSKLSAYFYKLFHGPDYSLINYSTQHCFDLVKGMYKLLEIFEAEETPLPLKNLLATAEKLLSAESLQKTRSTGSYKDFSVVDILNAAYFFRYKFKNQIRELIRIHAQLDVWLSMASAIKTYGLVFPEFIDSDKPFLKADGLYHLLLHDPVDYSISLDQQSNFLFLTGANMAGKSTFIKSVGAAVYLAHLGMGVPAKKLKLCYFDGLLSNINVADNIAKGESYFYNEVQRIKDTINRINNNKKWLILIDELFKGTNVQDAMKCSIAVIEGLIKMHQSLFILSTHLYEIGDSLRKFPNIAFYYFETKSDGEKLHFNYQLKPGISNDRLGFLILKQEGVVKMLSDL